MVLPHFPREMICSTQSLERATAFMSDGTGFDWFTSPAEITMRTCWPLLLRVKGQTMRTGSEACPS